MLLLCRWKRRLNNIASPSAEAPCRRLLARYSKPLPAQYANAEKALMSDQSKVEQYVASRSISAVRPALQRLCLHAFCALHGHHLGFGGEAAACQAQLKSDASQEIRSQ